jgi:hypothetical protein
MAHPQSSARGYFAKKKISIGNSTSTITYNTTGLVLSGALYLSGQGAGGKLSANSTAITLGGGLVATGTVAVSNQAVKGLLSANSTAIILPNSVRIGSKTSYLSSNSTGILLGARYLSTNTTGNATT